MHFPSRFVAVSVSIFLLLALAWSNPAKAGESYDNCAGFITSLPATIVTPGTWCLNKNLSTGLTAGNAIEIATDDATIDCNGFKLAGTGGLATKTRGINASNRRNLTVRNCKIRGFYYGVQFFGISGGGHVVDGNRIQDNTYHGLWIQGDGSVIRHNQVFHTGGSTIQAHAYGISTGYSVDVIDNTVSGVAATAGSNGFATGINSDISSAGTNISDNRVNRLVKDGAGLARGIWNSSSDYITVSGNHVVGTPNSANSIGLSCFNANGVAKDNVVSNFVVGIKGCTIADGNAVKN